MFKIRIVDIPKFQTAGSVFNTCDPGFCPDETGRCVPCDELGGYDFSQEQRKGQPIVPYKNERGEYVGGTGAVEHNWHRSKMETPCPQGMKKDANGNCVPTLAAKASLMGNALKGMMTLGSAAAQVAENKRLKKAFESSFRNKNFYSAVEPGFRGLTEVNTGFYMPDQIFNPNEGLTAQFGGGIYMGQKSNAPEKVSIRIVSGPQEMKYGGQSNYGFDSGWKRGYTKMNTTESEHVTASMSEEKNPKSPYVLEAEGGETLMKYKPGGMSELFSINGPRHTEGGVKMTKDQVQNDGQSSFMYSDTKKMTIKDPAILAHFGITSKKGATPAAISKKFKQLNTNKAVIMDQTRDLLTKKTAMLSNNRDEQYLAELAVIQEAMKGNEPPEFAMQKLGMNKAKYGGYVSIPHNQLPEFQLAGPTDPSLGRSSGFDIKATTPGYLDYNAITADYNKGYWDTEDNYNKNWIPKVNRAFSDPTKAKELLQRIETYAGQDAPDVVDKINKGKNFTEKVQIAKKLATDMKIGPYHAIVAGLMDVPTKPTEPPTTPTIPGEEKKKEEPKAASKFICVPDGKGSGTIQKTTVGYDTEDEAKANCGSLPKATPYDFLAPDKLNMLRAASVFPRQIYPFIPNRAFKPRNLALEDWRAPAAAAFSTQYAAPAQMLAAYTAPQGLASNLSNLAGQAAANITGKIIPSTLSRNVDRYNQFNAQEAARRDAVDAYNAAAAAKRYEGYATTLEGFDNALRKYLKEPVEAYSQGWLNRKYWDDINNTNQWFYNDPRTGQQVFRGNPGGWGTFGVDYTTGADGAGLGKLYAGYYSQMLKDITAANPDMDIEDVKDEARRLAMRAVDASGYTESYDEYGTKKKSTKKKYKS